ncbi:MAG TPA: metallophosphoesterase, partial [Paenibacillaceae bacterium]|nr:metallophosphoesterase [Paenibacillaceae bacterium]
EIWVGDERLQENRNYTIGTIDMFTFGVVFPTFKQGKDIRFYFPEFLRDVLQKELGNEKTLQESHLQHWLPF